MASPTSWRQRHTTLNKHFFTFENSLNCFLLLMQIDNQLMRVFIWKEEKNVRYQNYRLEWK